MKRSKELLNVVIGIIIDTENKVLLNKRKKNTTLSGYWEFPGGKIKPNETLNQALSRELFEELGIKLVTLIHLIQLNTSILSMTLYCYHSGS